MFYFIAILICYPLWLVVKTSSRRTDSPRAFLIYQTAKIGDLVCTTHVFRAVKRRFPNAHLSVIVSRNAAPILRNNTSVDDVIVVTNRLRGLYRKLELARRLFGRSYDVAIVLIPNPAYVFMSILALIPEVVTIVPDKAGVTQRAVSLFCKRVKHQTGTLTMATYLRALELIGVNDGDLRKEVFIERRDRDRALQFMMENGAVANNNPRVGLVVSSGNRMKALELKQITSLVEGLVRRLDATVVLLGTSNDRMVSRRVVRAVKLSNIVDSCGRFSLSELPAAVSLLDLVIGVDTGPIYIADSLDIPVVVIAGPCDMGDQRPLGKDVRIIANNCGCAPCSHTYLTPRECLRNQRACLSGLNMDEVLSVSEELLGT